MDERIKAAQGGLRDEKRRGRRARMKLRSMCSFILIVGVGISVSVSQSVILLEERVKLKRTGCQSGI